MNRNQTKILVENWRHVISEAMSASAEFLPEDWMSFKKSIEEWRASKKGYNPNTSTGTGVPHKIYGRMWNQFWSIYNSNSNKEMLFGSNPENCVDNFFTILKKIYRDGNNKSLFDKAFKSLGGNDKPKIASLVIGMIFEDFMHNMRGEVEGYCWSTKEEGQDIFRRFQSVYRELIEKGFGPDGECHFLAE